MKGIALKIDFFSTVKTGLLGELKISENLNIMLFTSTQENLFEQNASLEILTQS